MKLNGFDITKCLPFDIMHTLFEGVVLYHLNQLLHYLIDSCKYLTLEQLNHLISSHNYGYSEVDTKPSVVQRHSTTTSDFHFKLSGAKKVMII